MIPTPLPTEFPYEVQGRAYKIWVGNELQVKGEKHTSYILMQGVNNPDTGDEREEGAIAELRKLTGVDQLRVVVVGRDFLEREIGQVYSGDLNINLEMIRSGWGQCDGAEFERADEFNAAQTQAQLKKLGMWATAAEQD